MHMEGKTEEARADLARLALIRKQREEAQKKRDQEKRGNQCLISIKLLMNSSHSEVIHEYNRYIGYPLF